MRIPRRPGSRSRSRRAERGQSMALFALTVMLLTLMVTMTLGIGMKAKEKMEVQHLTDAAAYSNAVYEARALNGVAILNRAEVSVMVTLAATQANISYASMYLASLQSILQWMVPAGTAATTACAFGVAPCCATATRFATLAPQIISQYNEVYNDYYQSGDLDHRAGQQARSIQGAATAVHQRQKEIFDDMRNNHIANQQLVAKIVQEASNGQRWDELRVDAAASSVSMKEIKTKSAAPTAGPETGDAEFWALSPRNVSRELGVKAAMGSRGEEFVRNRDNGAIISAKIMLDLSISPPEFLLLSNSGGAAWGAEQSKHPPPGAAPLVSNADDEGTLTGLIGNPACPASIVLWSPEAYVISNDTTLNDDVHTWTGEGGHGEDQTYHTMGDCTACPGVWTMFIDLNPDVVGGDRQSLLWGQPKNMAVVRRDTNERCGDAIYGGDCAGVDPWNYMFRFRFTPAGETFDNRGLQLTGGANISNQIGASTGITYYHRPGHWREPPNFFNPFWRATLASVTVDSEGIDDLKSAVQQGGGASAGTARQVIDALEGQGYEGW